jgi:membrane protein implicated in regulation of membrane protease activity
MLEWTVIEPHWGWIGVGLLLCGLEMLVPGVFLLWLGLAALLTGLVTLATGIGVAAQLIVFGVLAVAAVFVGKRQYSDHGIASEDPLLNDRLARLVGATVTVEMALIAGRGRVRVGDSVWPAEGPDMPIGTIAVVTATRAGALIVEPR